MPHHLPARRLPSLRVLVLACAATLAGCSILPGQGNVTTAVPTEGPQPNAPGAALPEGLAVESGTMKKAHAETDKEPGWNLQTPKSGHFSREAEVLTFEDAWRRAIENDPEYRAAMSALAAAETESRLGWAAILPQVQAGYSRNKIRGLQRNFTLLGTRENDLEYDSRNAYVQLQQPLFNIDRYATFQRGRERVRLGEAEFALQEQEAALRLVEVYLDAVAARGYANLARSLAASLEEQAQAQEALFRKNEGSVVDAQETRARLALAQADVLRAQDEARTAMRRLQSVIGPGHPQPVGLDQLDTAAAPEQPLVYWLERARASGAAIRVAEARTRVADTEVRRALARHLPSADLLLTYSDADSDNLDTLSQSSNTFQVGVRMNIPIFSGGYDTANHARSRHQLRQAEHELAQAREELAAEVTRQYTAAQGSAQRIAALESAVASGEESLEAARKGYAYGINSNLDVLRRQDSVYQTRHELLRARIEWLQARAALALAVGEAPAVVFDATDRVLIAHR